MGIVTLTGKSRWNFLCKAREFGIQVVAPSFYDNNEKLTCESCESKPKKELDKLNNESNEANAKVIYYIFNSLSLDKFYRIATCKCFKKTWDILATKHKGTSMVKLSKPQMLTTKFESIKINEHETFFEFYTKFNIIVNS